MYKGKVCEDIAIKDLNRKEPVVSKKEISRLTDEWKCLRLLELLCFMTNILKYLF